MTKTRVTNFILLAISTIGAYLVSEQIISQESLIEVQGITGIALGTGGVTLFTFLNIAKLIPQEVATKIIEKIGIAKVQQFFADIKKILEAIKSLGARIDHIENELLLDRQVKNELGVYDEVSQELKDKLNV